MNFCRNRSHAAPICSRLWTLVFLDLLLSFSATGLAGFEVETMVASGRLTVITQPVENRVRVLGRGVTPFKLVLCSGCKPRALTDRVADSRKRPGR